MAVLSEDGILRNFTAEDFVALWGGDGGDGEENPAAVLTSINPNTVVHPAPDTTITLTGTGFVSGAVAKSAATSLATTYVSPTELTAVVPADRLDAVASFSITVTNPGAPPSDPQTFTVT
jgi:IPT/TIG domain